MSRTSCYRASTWRATSLRECSTGRDGTGDVALRRQAPAKPRQGDTRRRLFGPAVSRRRKSAPFESRRVFSAPAEPAGRDVTTAAKGGCNLPRPTRVQYNGRVADTRITDPLGRTVVLHGHTWFGHVVKQHPEMRPYRRLAEAGV